MHKMFVLITFARYVNDLESLLIEKELEKSFDLFWYI